MTFLFPEDEIPDKGSMGDRERAPKRQFVNTTPEQFQEMIDNAITDGRYNPDRPDAHMCEYCGAPMKAIHSKTRQEGKAICQHCAATRDGCDCPDCERTRMEIKC
jgi:hypothetical protein